MREREKGGGDRERGEGEREGGRERETGERERGRERETEGGGGGGEGAAVETLSDRKTETEKEKPDQRQLFVGWLLTSQQHASVSQGRICTDNFTCCHTETEVADQTFYLTQLQYTDTRQASPSADPVTQGAWQGSHWSANF